MNVPLRASVVVPTCRRPDLLARCLEALAGQRGLAPGSWEVIVVDDGCDEETSRVVRAAGDRSPGPVHYLTTLCRQGPVVARNRGWQASRGTVVAFTDDNCLPDPGWLAAGLAAFEPGVTAVQGRLIGEIAAAHCFYRRSALVGVGGFDERFPAAWREDSDLYFTLLERGGVFRQAHDAVVLHPARPAGWGAHLEEQKQARFNALLYKKHPALYRQRIQAGPPWELYLTVAALLGAAGAAAAGQPAGLAAAAALWAGLTARFCLRRLAGTSRSPRQVAAMIATSAVAPLLSTFWRLHGAFHYRVLFF
jgi:GT2 family glycosyltransferase